MVVASLHESAMPVLDKPRVISEIKKTKNGNKKKLQASITSVLDGKPRISGELEWYVNGRWETRIMEVRDGCLLVNNSSTGLDLRLPLRHLSLQSASTPRTFSLVRDHQPVATFQARSDEQYERWVKTLVVELMRQTPLEAVRFLDILGITATIVSTRGQDQYPNVGDSMRRGISENNLSSGDDSPAKEDYDHSHMSTPEENFTFEDCFAHRGRPKERFQRECLNNRKKSDEDCEMTEESVSELCEINRGRTKERGLRVRVKNCESQVLGNEILKRPIRAQSSDPVRKMSDSDSELEDVDEQEVAALLLKCQQVDNYVPVREKRRLFESLCRRGRRLAQSSDNLCVNTGNSEVKMKRKKRARSLHDLSRSSKGSVAVREICRYFEQRGQEPREQVLEESPRHKPPTGERGNGGCNAYLSRRRVQRAERRLARYKQQAADTEENIWRLQEEMATLDYQRNQTASSNERSQELRLYAALEMRLAEEEARLSRINEEAARTLREIELATDKFETALMQSSEMTTKNNGRQ